MANSVSVEQLQTALASSAPPLVLDVRREPIYQEATEVLPHSTWRDPAKVQNWSIGLNVTQPVVVYCVHGHQVSQGCADALSQTGLTVHYLEGGIEGWKEAGGPTQPKT